MSICLALMYFLNIKKWSLWVQCHLSQSFVATQRLPHLSRSACSNCETAVLSERVGQPYNGCDVTRGVWAGAFTMAEQLARIFGAMVFVWEKGDRFTAWPNWFRWAIGWYFGWEKPEIGAIRVFMCVFFWEDFSYTNKINPCVIPNSLEDLGRFLYRNPPELCLLCLPEPSGTSSAIAGTLPAICAAALRNLISLLVRNPPEPHRPSAPEPSGTSSAICTGTLPKPCLLSAPELSRASSAICTRTRRNLVCYLHRNHPEPHQPSAPKPAGICYLHRNHPEPHQLSAPEPSGTSSAFCTGTVRNFISFLHQPHQQPCLLSDQNLLEPRQPSAPEPAGTSSAICAGTIRNLISHLHRNPPELRLLCVPEPSGTSSAFYTGTLREPHQLSAPEPSGTSWAFCTRTLRNLISFLHRNPPEPCLLSAPEPSGTSSAICTGTRRNLVCYLHRNHPEPSGSSSAVCAWTVRNLISFLHRNPLEPHQLSARNPLELSGTLRNLLWNLGLQLHRIAPELFWVKDPIASFAVGEKSGWIEWIFILLRNGWISPFFTSPRIVLNRNAFFRNARGTEEDRVNCPFYFKIGACRNGPLDVENEKVHKGIIYIASCQKKY